MGIERAGSIAGWMLIAACALTAAFARELVVGRYMTAIVAFCTAITVLGVAMVLLGSRTPRWLLYVAPLLVIVLGTIPDSGESLLVWAVLYAGCLLPKSVTVSVTGAAVAIFGTGAALHGGERAWPLWCQVSSSLVLICAVVVGMRRRIGQLVTALHEQARSDDLTGVANRRQFTEHLEEQLAAHSRVGEPLALCFLDIDNFKRINDTYGHSVGDPPSKISPRYFAPIHGRRISLLVPAARNSP